jgi:hypothetical protein
MNGKRRKRNRNEKCVIIAKTKQKLLTYLLGDYRYTLSFYFTRDLCDVPSIPREIERQVFISSNDRARGDLPINAIKPVQKVRTGPRKGDVCVCRAYKAISASK